LSSRSFAQSGLCGAKIDRFRRIPEMPRSPVVAHLRRALARSDVARSRNRNSKRAREKSAEKKMFRFASSIGARFRERASTRRARRFERVVRGAPRTRRGTFFGAGC